MIADSTTVNTPYGQQINYPYGPAFTSISQLSETTSDLQSAFIHDLGSTATSDIIASGENYLTEWVPLASLTSTIISSTAETNTIDAQWQAVLGRSPSSSDLSTALNGLRSGTSLASERSNLAQSQEAQNDVNTIFEQVLGRPVDSGTLTGDENSLASGATLAQIRTGVAQSQEAASDIGTIYQQVLGRSVGSGDAGNVTALENAMAAGSTLAASRSSIAHSSEAASDIGAIYQQVLGRSVGSGDAGNVTALENAMAAGSTLAASRSSIAGSSEAGSDINNIYEQILNRAVDSGTLSSTESSLAAGATLAQVRSNVAYSNEATADINTIYEQALDRAVDTGSLPNIESSLVTGLTLAQERSNVADSAEAVADIAAYGTFLFGTGETVTTSSWESAEENAVATGQATLDSSFVALEQGNAGVAVIQSVYADNGQAAPSGTGLQGAATALVNLAYAWHVVQGQSQTQWTTEAGGYQAQSGVGSFQVTVANLAGSQAQAVALVASALDNSYMDAAPDQASASASFAAGGEQAQDNLLDQSTGLDAQAIVTQLNNPGCSDWQTFQETHATDLSNQTIKAIPANASNPSYAQGIVWSSQNTGASLNQRLSQQGYPYENYVTSVLGSSFVQTPNAYKVFDHWSATSGIAVSDKTLDTAFSYYGGNTETASKNAGSASNITTKMMQYGLKMV